MQRDATHLSELVDLIYSAALHPEQWSHVVAAIAASFDSSKGLLFTPYLAPQQGGFIFPVNIDEATLKLWASTYIEHDIWSIHMKQKGIARDGLVLIDEEMTPQVELLASRFYQEFLSTIGIARVISGTVFAGSPDLPYIGLTAFRDLHEPAFDDGDKAWMQLLVAHVSRATGLMLRLDTARVQNAALLASFDRLNFGVALLNDSMQVLHLNLVGKSVLARDDGLRLNAQQRLEGCAAETGSPLRNVSNWLDGVRNTPLFEQPHFLQGVVVRRTGKHDQSERSSNASAKECYDLQCVPLPQTDTWFAQQQDARYVVFITDPKAVQLPGDERLAELYGLTATQAKLACKFARGASYKEVARCFQISLDTVRSHVKEIYRKTRVNRQSDLVHLMLSISQSGV